ncbi:MAG: DUF2085 domain-containing protein [Candidatus Thermoplasmatota archaeon]|nr:DUF2085 domain-containing protein [Candidatus Thermoplasmatota archaeon]
MQRRAKYFRSVIFIFFVLFSLWILLQFLAPLALPKGSVSDLSGLVAISDNEDTINDMGLPWGFVYSAGDRLCHQKAERSFFINDNQMPFCSRCTAIWLGFAIGLGFMVFYVIELNGKFLFALLISLVPIGVDGVGQLFGFWESTNIIRVITGLLIGIICGVAIGVIIDEIKTIHVFKNTKSR